MDKCSDNRFEVIERAKKEILRKTNIKSRKDEMTILDDILFRCWQMGWLKQFEPSEDIKLATAIYRGIYLHYKQRELFSKGNHFVDSDLEYSCLRHLDLKFGELIGRLGDFSEEVRNKAKEIVQKEIWEKESKTLNDIFEGL